MKHGDSDGLNTTLRLLAQSGNASAGDVLACALTAPEPAIQAGILRSLLSRRDEAGHRAVLRHWPRFDENAKSIAAEYPGRLLHPILDWMTSGNEQLTSIACDAALPAVEYDVLPTLAMVASDRQNPARDVAAHSLVGIGSNLAQKSHSPPDLPGPPRSPIDPRPAARLPGNRARAIPTTAAQGTRRSLPVPVRPGLAGPATFPAGRRGSPARSRSWTPSVQPSSGRREATDRLAGGPSPPGCGPRIVSQRQDLDSLKALFTRMAGALSPHQRRNLSRIKEVPWADMESTWLESLDESVQQGAVHTLTAAGVPRDEAFRVVAHLARFGSAGGRCRGRGRPRRIPGNAGESADRAGFER